MTQMVCLHAAQQDGRALSGGIRFNIEQQTSAAKQENMVLSIGDVREPGSDLWHVHQALGVLGTDITGISRMPARRSAVGESRSSRPVPRSGGSNLLWISTTIRGALLGLKRAAGHFPRSRPQCGWFPCQHGNFLVLLPIVIRRRFRIRASSAM